MEENEFKRGDIVRHRTSGDKGVVLAGPGQLVPFPDARFAPRTLKSYEYRVSFSPFQTVDCHEVTLAHGSLV